MEWFHARVFGPAPQRSADGKQRSDNMANNKEAPQAHEGPDEKNRGHHHEVEISVNGQKIHLDHPVPDARQILKAANYVPADDCILVREIRHETRAIGLDETVDLREPGIGVFWAFRGDCIHRFTVGEGGFDWGEATIKEPTLRVIAHVKDDEIIIVERHDQPGQELGPEDELHLSGPETKHLRVESRLVKVFFQPVHGEDKAYEIPRGVYTTEELMAKFPIEPGYLLNLKTHDGELVTLKPGEKICVKNGMHFYSQVPGGGSS
jgi:hypothetical protein